MQRTLSKVTKLFALLANIIIQTLMWHRLHHKNVHGAQMGFLADHIKRKWGSDIILATLECDGAGDSTASV